MQGGDGRGERCARVGKFPTPLFKRCRAKRRGGYHVVVGY